MKNFFFSLYLALRLFEIFFFFFPPSEPRRKEDLKQPQSKKRLKKKFFMDSQSYNKIKEDSKAASEPERIEEEVSHGF